MRAKLIQCFLLLFAGLTCFLPVHGRTLTVLPGGYPTRSQETVDTNQDSDMKEDAVPSPKNTGVAAGVRIKEKTSFGNAAWDKTKFYAFLIFTRKHPREKEETQKKNVPRVFAAAKESKGLAEGQKGQEQTLVNARSIPHPAKTPEGERTRYVTMFAPAVPSYPTAASIDGGWHPAPQPPPFPFAPQAPLTEDTPLSQVIHFPRDSDAAMFYEYQGKDYPGETATPRDTGFESEKTGKKEGLNGEEGRRNRYRYIY